jgi:N-methylhydantoinase A
LPAPWGEVEALVWQRTAVEGVTGLDGPAIIEQPDTTVLVWPGWRGRPAAGGTLILERED